MRVPLEYGNKPFFSQTVTVSKFNIKFSYHRQSEKAGMCF